MRIASDADIIRHLTADPPEMARRATAFLAEATELYLADLIAAEIVYVLESYYEAPRDQIATAIRSLISMTSIVTVDPALMLRAIKVYELDRIDFAEAYLVAYAESTGVGTVASFDRSSARSRPWNASSLDGAVAISGPTTTPQMRT